MHATMKLDTGSAQRAIENAVRTQAQIVISAPALGDATINGFLIAGDESALLLEVTGQLPLPADRLLNTHCEVRIYSDQRYRFSSTITAAPEWGKSRSLAIARPTSLGLIERRRFLRAKLAPSARVRLEWHRAGADHTHSAAILNVSPDGMACRIDDAAAAAIASEYMVRAKFQVPGRNQSFDLAATVCNKTPASEGHTIIGLQFESTPEVEDDLASLREALLEPTPSTIDSEVCV